MEKFPNSEQLENILNKLDDRGYRRGYVHGYLQALENVKQYCADSSVSQLEEFAEKELNDWRIGPPNEMPGPPLFSTHR